HGELPTLALVADFSAGLARRAGLHQWAAHHGAAPGAPSAGDPLWRARRRRSGGRGRSISFYSGSGFAADFMARLAQLSQRAHAGTDSAAADYRYVSRLIIFLLAEQSAQDPAFAFRRP